MGDENPGEGFDLVMPFVVCESAGGPYEDKAFTAGIHFGATWEALQRGRCWEAPGSVPSPLVPQLDLAAMHFGYTLTADEVEGQAEWSAVAYARSAAGDPQ